VTQKTVTATERR